MMSQVNIVQHAAERDDQCEGCGYPFDTRAKCFTLQDEYGAIVCSQECADDIAPLFVRPCPVCGKFESYRNEFDEYHSLGIYAGRYCSDHCWSQSGYRDEPASAFDPADCGESY